MSEPRLQEFAVEVARNAPPASQIQPPRQYCWTHGPCGHSSKDCNRPAPNHVTTATASNRQGGTQVNHYGKK